MGSGYWAGDPGFQEVEVGEYRDCKLEGWLEYGISIGWKGRDDCGDMVLEIMELAKEVYCIWD